MNKSCNTIKRDLSVFMFFLLFSFGFLYICTASSPRYAINPWNDANAFLTVGKSMAGGLTVYKDIFEQKGPLLYLIHALACLICDTGFTGVYVFQSVSLCITLFAAYKVSSLYIGVGLSVVSSVLTGIVAVDSLSYYYGDSAEEFCLPLLMISIYFFCKYFKDTDSNRINKLTFFIVGFFAGCVAMIKFTVIGFWFAWAAYISLYTWIAKKDFRSAALNALVFIGGMITAILPWIIYFGIKGALKDFIYTYFILNATAYPMNENYGLLTRLWKPLYIIGTNIITSPAIIVFSFIGMIFFLFSGIFTEKKVFSRLSVPFVCFLGIYIIYFGIRNYSYYLLPLSVFSVFSFIALFSFIPKIIKNKKAISVFSWILCGVVIVSSFIGSAHFNVTAQSVARCNESTFQYKAADYIQKHNPNGAILNYNCLDCGVYLAANQIPQFRHFERQNLIYEKYSENIDEQNRYITEGLAEYVVTIAKPGENLEDIYKSNSALKAKYNLVFSENYKLREQTNYKKSFTRTFYLFELKEG